MAEGKDMMKFATIMIVLFLLMIVTGVTYIGADYLKKVSCEQASSVYVYSGETCQVSSTNTTEVTLTAITKMEVIETGAGLLLGLLSLVLIVSIFAIVIKQAKQFQSGF